MDPVSAAQTAWSIFNACYQAYGVVSQAIGVGTEARRWDVQMRVERVRFEVWGRTLGFLDEKTGSPKDLGAADMVTSGLSDILEVEAANKLVCDLLKHISLTLSEFRDTAEKYSLETKQEQQNASPSSAVAEVGTPPSKSGRRSKAAKSMNKMWESTKVFTNHVVYVLADKGLVETLLQRLTGLNNSLEKLLTLSQKIQYAKATTSGILVGYQRPEELEFLLRAIEPPRNGGEPAAVLLASARVKQLCLEMDTRGARILPPADNPVESYSLPLESVQGFQLPQKTKQELLWPVGAATYIRDDEPPVKVIIEWRSAKTSTPRFKIENRELVQRRDKIVGLLRRTSSMAGAEDYRVLDCVGYVESEGREDGQKTPIVGFISRYPAWADHEQEPSTMHGLLTEAFGSQDPGMIPSLRTRFRLARYLANALYQLQCSNWLHRNLSSHQVVFFHDKGSGAGLRLDEPYLVGFQYSRPDDNVGNSRGGDGWAASEGFNINKDFPEVYLRPEFSNPNQRRYQRSDDVYSMGVMLFETAFWEPAHIFLEEHGSTVWDAAKRIAAAAENELASEVGELYRDAVVCCLRGLRPIRERTDDEDDSDTGDEYDGRYRGEDPEYGLEIDFLWKVLREIEKCKV